MKEHKTRTKHTKHTMKIELMKKPGIQWQRMMLLHEKRITLKDKSCNAGSSVSFRISSIWLRLREIDTNCMCDDSDLTFRCFDEGRSGKISFVHNSDML